MRFFKKFINLYKKANLKFLKFKYRKYLKKSSRTNGVTNVLDQNVSLRFDCAFEERKKEVEKRIENLVKKAKNNPYRLLAYIEKHSTPVYRINAAGKILAFINETEGFITPKKGFKALYLNLIIKKKLSLNFSECFILRNLPPEPYHTIHQFYNWYSFKSGIMGYEYEAQEKSKRIIYSKNIRNKINELGISDIIKVKEAIKRDIDALDFVINLAKNTEGAKKAFGKIFDKEAKVNI